MDLQHQITNDLYEMYPTPYEPVYTIKEKVTMCCIADYITHVYMFEKTGKNNTIHATDNSFFGFCRDIFLNPHFDYFESFKFHDNCKEVDFETLWKTMMSYNHCKDKKDTPFKNLDLNDPITLNNVKCKYNTADDFFKHHPCPLFIYKNNFIQGIKFGNSNCSIFLAEFKDTFCIIACMGS
jgi:hypothetical protein